MNLVGQVNLSAALVVLERFDEALETLQRIRDSATKLQATRLLGNSFEQLAQIYLRTGKVDQAEIALNTASNLLMREQSMDQLFVKKWQSVLHAQKTGDPSGLAQLQKQFQEQLDWESVRETELFILSTRFNEEAFLKLYFGTPYVGYRARIEKILKIKPLNSEYVSSKGSEVLLDLTTGEVTGSRAKLKSGQQNHRILKAMFEDLYRPKTVDTLFCSLFPGDYYDVHSSPTRVHQALFRFRQWSDETDFPIKISETAGRLFAETVARIGIRFSLENATNGPSGGLWLKLRAKVESKAHFRSVDVAALLGVSSSTAKRLLLWACQQGEVERLGLGCHCHYRLRSRAA
jgi:hypothetical protein